MVDAIHYFPSGEVWLEEVPASLPVDYFFHGEGVRSGDRVSTTSGRGIWIRGFPSG